MPATTPTDIPAVAPALVVTGPQGTVARLRPAGFAAIPIHLDRFGKILDIWRMPGDMHMVCIRGSSDEYGFLLCYADPQVRRVANELGIDASLAVDVWHFQKMPGVYEDDQMARKIMKDVAAAASQGSIPFSPIRPDDRRRWQFCVNTMCAIAVRNATSDDV